MVNKWQTTCPLQVALADGHQVMSTHMCDIQMEVLLLVLTSYIIPHTNVIHLIALWNTSTNRSWLNVLI
jgi:hypothetical protein